MRSQAVPDSTALFHLLVRLIPGRIKGAAYIDHKLRPGETDAEIAHVKDICQKAGVTFHQSMVNVPLEKQKSGESTEECARRLRYLALEEIRLKIGADLTAVGHTGDDLVEEVLIRMIRGSGLKGLTGIRPSFGTIIRPLIDLSKNQVLEYLDGNKLYYCLDSSNQSRTHLRNRVRLDLLPLLEEAFNPSVKTTIRKTAKILTDEEDFIAAETNYFYNNLVKTKTSPNSGHAGNLVLATGEFNTLHAALKRRIIEKMIWLCGAKPSFQKINDTLRLCDSGQNGAELHMNSGLIIHKSAGEVFFSVHPGKNQRFRETETFDDIVIINAPGKYYIDQLQKTLSLTMLDEPPADFFSSDRLFISLKHNVFPITLRQPLQGESFIPLGAPGRKKVLRFLSDRKVPRRLRHCFPVLASGNEIVAIAGICVSDAFRIDEETSKCLEISWK